MQTEFGIDLFSDAEKKLKKLNWTNFESLNTWKNSDGRNIMYKDYPYLDIYKEKNDKALATFLTIEELTLFALWFKISLTEWNKETE